MYCKNYCGLPKLAVLTILLLSSYSAVGATPTEIELKFTSPAHTPGAQQESGWSLALEASVKNSQLDPINPVASPALTGAQLSAGEDALYYLILDDPDQCPIMDNADWRTYLATFSGPSFKPYNNCIEDQFCEEIEIGCDTPPCYEIRCGSREVLIGLDETYVEFYADTDQPSVPDDTGNPALRTLLTDSAGAGTPTICGSTGDCTTFGPLTGDDVEDGYGIGVDDDLASLFLFSENGVGLIWNEPDWALKANPVGTVEFGVRNLAGLLNQVSYQFSVANDLMYETRINASMLVPSALFKNMVQIDSSQRLLSVDGASARKRKFKSPLDAAQRVMKKTLKRRSGLEIKAFMVSGVAPAYLYDHNANGVIDPDDAVLAGYTVLSNLAEIKLGFIHTAHESGYNGRDLNVLEVAQ